MTSVNPLLLPLRGVNRIRKVNNIIFGRSAHLVDNLCIKLNHFSTPYIAYEKKYGQFSRIYQVAKLMLYAPASGLYSCPLAMTGKIILN